MFRFLIRRARCDSTVRTEILNISDFPVAKTSRQMNQNFLLPFKKFRGIFCRVAFYSLAPRGRDGMHAEERLASLHDLNGFDQFLPKSCSPI
jgi:hypothetical protein